MDTTISFHKTVRATNKLLCFVTTFVDPIETIVKYNCSITLATKRLNQVNVCHLTCIALSAWTWIQFRAQQGIMKWSSSRSEHNIALGIGLGRVPFILFWTFYSDTRGGRR